MFILVIAVQFPTKIKVRELKEGATKKVAHTLQEQKAKGEVEPLFEGSFKGRGLIDEYQYVGDIAKIDGKIAFVITTKSSRQFLSPTSQFGSVLTSQFGSVLKYFPYENRFNFSAKYPTTVVTELCNERHDPKIEKANKESRRISVLTQLTGQDFKTEGDLQKEGNIPQYDPLCFRAFARSLEDRQYDSDYTVDAYNLSWQALAAWSKSNNGQLDIPKYC